MFLLVLDTVEFEFDVFWKLPGKCIEITFQHGSIVHAGVFDQSWSIAPLEFQKAVALKRLEMVRPDTCGSQKKKRLMVQIIFLF